MFVTLLTMGDFVKDFSSLYTTVLERQWPDQKVSLDEIKSSSYVRATNLLFLWFNGIACSVSKHATTQPIGTLRATDNFQPDKYQRVDDELEKKTFSNLRIIS